MRKLLTFAYVGWYLMGIVRYMPIYMAFLVMFQTWKLTCEYVDLCVDAEKSTDY